MRVVESAREEFGLKASCEVIGLPRSTWYYHKKRKRSVEERYEHLKDPLHKIALEHPEYGHRRVKVELEETYGIRVGKDTIRKLHKLWELSLARNVKRPRPTVVQKVLKELGGSINLLAGIEKEEIDVLEVLYTDYTEVVYDNGTKKAQLMPIIDHRSKIVVGWSLGKTCTSEVALQAWERCEEGLEVFGQKPVGIIVHHDLGAAYTSRAWLYTVVRKCKARVSYALRGCKDNTQVESFNGKFKDENRSLFLDARNLEELKTVVAERVMYYNTSRRHSSIGNQAPIKYLEKRLKARSKS